MNYKRYFPIEEYYKKVIIPLNPKRFHYGSGGKMVCPLHSDHDPSLGVIEKKDSEVCHCFGCGYWGDVVDLNIDINRRYKGKHLNRKESIDDLCYVFELSRGTVAEEETDVGDSRSKDTKRLDLISSKDENFDISDMRYSFLDGKLKKKGVGYFNALMMSMIYELKKKEDDN